MNVVIHLVSFRMSSKLEKQILDLVADDISYAETPETLVGDVETPLFNNMAMYLDRIRETS